MYKKISVIDLQKAIQSQITDKTGLRCFDFVEKNTPSPFYFIEFIGKQPNDTKTMFRESFSFYIHSIAEPADSSVGIYKLIQQLDDALSEDVKLSVEFDLIRQVNNGVLNIKTDETNEKHAVSEFVFDVCYGYKIK